MKFRTLGKSGLSVSEIGLGCWQLGGDFGPVDDTQSRQILEAATAAGITFFDTADVYGGGQSESRIGHYKQETGASPIVATKVGRSADLFPDGYSEASIRSHLQNSAKRLGVDTLDLIQLHCVPTDVLRDGEIFNVMDRAVADGLCSHWGASVETIEEAQICLAHGSLTSLQIIFNLYRQDAVHSLFDDAIAADVGIIVRLPLASGVLSGKFQRDQTFADSDHRNYNANGEMFSVGETFSGIDFHKGLSLLDHLRPHVPSGMSMADFALRWILDHPAVSSIIAGVSKPEQAARNAAASDLPPLGPETHTMLSQIYSSEIREHVRCPI